MADAANAGQRNLYARKDGTRFSGDYRDGKGRPYADSLRKLSWPVPSDVPSIGQESAVIQMPKLKVSHNYTPAAHFLHPTHFGRLRFTDHLSFSKSMGNLGLGSASRPREFAAMRR